MGSHEGGRIRSLVDERWWGGAESLIRVFISSVTKKNDGTGSAQDFILSFGCESRELGGRGTPNSFV